MTTKIPYGLRDEYMMSTGDVPSGKGCGCVCPACGSPLIARKGKHNAHHFAHAQQASDCPHPAETAIHQMAKQLVAAATNFAVPEWPVRATVPGDGGEGKALICRRGRLTVCGSSLEQASEDGRLRPDVRLWGTIEGFEEHGEIELWVEIAVTHRVDEEKARALQSGGVRCVEVDLGGWDPMEPADELETTVCGLSLYKGWVSHPRYEAALREAKERADAGRQAKAREEEEARKRRERELQEEVARRERILEIAREAFPSGQWLTLPIQRAVARSLDGNLHKTIRERGPWWIEKVEKSPRHPTAPGASEEATADLRLTGPEGELWIVFVSPAAPGGHSIKSLRAAQKPAIEIELTKLEKYDASRLQWLANKLRTRTDIKRWISIPGYGKARDAAFEELKKRRREQERERQTNDLRQSADKADDPSVIDWIAEPFKHGGS